MSCSSEVAEVVRSPVNFLNRIFSSQCRLEFSWETLQASFSQPKILQIATGFRAFMSFATPEDLEKYHVRHVYNQIAPHFVGSTHKAWPKVEEFLLSLPAGSLIADVGEFCKYFVNFP